MCIRDRYMGSCLGLTPLLAVKLSVFDWCISTFKISKDDKSFDLWTAVFGAFAGVCSVAVAYPADVVRRFMQVRGLDSSGIESKGLAGCVKGIYSMGGILRFYKGLSAALLKEIPSSAIMFMLNERMKKMLKVS
eukprot:TRINITY_DN10815_c0_g1_i7.p1 TRINITY_DN10815_c0_g1~~TRINITY_DN10815_c0_g1_i7.p1  ORF type:complete len:134 (+),score=36.15 TRINITY_DN10815_c0_g1_i7:3-404(+)